MKIFSLLLIICIIANNTIADECPGKVQRVLSWPEKCDGQIAFKLETTDGKWVCALNDVSSSAILMAYAANKTVVLRIDDAQASTCANLSHYHTPQYIYVYN